MMPLDVMLLAMRLDVESGQWRSAASIAEKTAPYLHAKRAPRSEEGCRPRNHDQGHPGPAGLSDQVASYCVYSCIFGLT